VGLDWFDVASSFYVPVPAVTVSLLTALIAFSILFLLIVPLAYLLFLLAGLILPNQYGAVLGISGVLFSGYVVLMLTEGILSGWLSLDTWGPTVIIPVIVYELIAGVLVWKLFSGEN